MKERFGDITSLTEGIIVQQVNAQGVMGSGVARAIRDKWPLVYHKYAAALGPEYTQKDSGRHFLGKVIWTQVDDHLHVASIVGQQFFGRNGHRYTSYDALDDGFKEIAQVAHHSWDLEVHYPLIGCGLGGGDWTIVSAIISARLGTIKHTLWKQK